MAPRNHRSAVEDRLRAARFAERTAKGLYRVHVKVCAQCTRAGRLPDKRCDYGWALAKDETRARNAARRLGDEVAMADAQGTLW